MQGVLRGWMPVPPSRSRRRLRRRDRRSVNTSVYVVGGQVGYQRRDGHAGHHLCIGAVYRRLVQLAPAPKGDRRGTLRSKAPHERVVRAVAEGCQQPGKAIRGPVRWVDALRAPGQVGWRFLQAAFNDRGCPVVDVPEVEHEAAEVPAGTRRHRDAQVRTGGGGELQEPSRLRLDLPLLPGRGPCAVFAGLRHLGLSRRRPWRMIDSVDPTAARPVCRAGDPGGSAVRRAGAVRRRPYLGTRRPVGRSVVEVGNAAPHGLGTRRRCGADRLLLRWHERFNRYQQVGGHGDAGEDDPLGVALREAREETGLTDLRP